MKYIKTYEAWKPLIEIKTKDGSVLRYKEEWKVAGHPEREEISQYLMDIFQELKDEGYSVRDGGYMAFNDYPYVWISSRTRRRRGNMDWDMVNDCILSAQSYLESKGFITLVDKLNDNQVYLYFDKNPIIKEAFKLKIPGEIKGELEECFLSLADLIHSDTRTNPGVKISGIAKNEYNYLEGFGRPNDYIRVMVVPRLRPITDYSESGRRFRNQSFPQLNYTPADMNVDEFYSELIDCVNLAESTGFNINCAMVAWSSGGEFRGPGELTKKFKYNGIDPEENPLNDRSGWRGAYDIEKLEWFLKTNVKDRLRWIKIFYS